MKKSFTLVIAIVAALLLTVSCTSRKKTDTQPLTKEEIVKRGEYLVTIIGCNDCHSPKKMGPKGPEIIPELMLSGFQAGRQLPAVDSKLAKDWLLMTPDLTAFYGPWGISFSANLTSDETGIGNWPEGTFKIALTKGKFKGFEGSRDLLPPMPWQNFVGISDDDLEAIYNYLLSTKPVKNIVPPPVPPAGSN